MGDWIFAWIFALVIYYVLPDAVLTKTETVTMIGFFVFTGLYVWHLIEKCARRYRKKRMIKRSRRAYRNRGVA